MKKFMGEDFLLNTHIAKKLYHNHASKMPIIDYHCHIDPKDIANDVKFDNITKVWLSEDHYKWRVMRLNGINEHSITTCMNEDPLVTFKAFASSLPQAIGNPIYHWTYLELKNYFGITKQLCNETCEEIYNECNKRLNSKNMSVRGLIKQSNVELIGTTDDPLDNLEWHNAIAKDKTFDVKVLPTFRPDKAINIEKEGFVEYVKLLGDKTGKNIKTVKEVCNALNNRIMYFNEHGACISDHALDTCVYEVKSENEIDEILNKALLGKTLEQNEIDAYKTYILISLAKKYCELNWVMQLHFGCIRNVNTKMYKKLGQNTGFDAVSNITRVDLLAKLLDAFNENGMPKMILYSLNQYDNEALATIAGCFQINAQCPGQIQLGSAWWFNDTKAGIEKQLTDLANLGVLGNFIGMLTDSRSFLSYARHEYFRRILCNWIGNIVENGEYIDDMKILGEMVENICYYNAKKYFGVE